MDRYADDAVLLDVWQKKKGRSMFTTQTTVQTSLFHCIAYTEHLTKTVKIIQKADRQWTIVANVNEAFDCIRRLYVSISANVDNINLSKHICHFSL